MPLKTGNVHLLLDYQRFFLGPNLTTIPMTLAAHHRAALIRGTHNQGLADSLHLAVAVEQRLGSVSVQ